MPIFPLLTLFSNVVLHIAHCALAKSDAHKNKTINTLSFFIMPDNKG